MSDGTESIVEGGPKMLAFPPTTFRSVCAGCLHAKEVVVFGEEPFCAECRLEKSDTALEEIENLEEQIREAVQELEETQDENAEASDRADEEFDVLQKKFDDLRVEYDNQISENNELDIANRALERKVVELTTESGKFQILLKEMHESYVGVETEMDKILDKNNILQKEIKTLTARIKDLTNIINEIDRSIEGGLL